MKKSIYKLSALLMAIAISGSLIAQVPQKFNYQGIARDAKGNPLGGKTLSLKLSVLPTADASAAEYEEVQTVTTNDFGLYTLQIGSGQSLTGDMKTVQWETGNKYIRVAIDLQGGSNYADAGTTQLLSVPYAIYADKAGSTKSSGDRTGTVSSNAAHVAGDANYITKFTALNTIGKSRLFDNGTSIGLGTSTPVATAAMHIRRTTSGQYLYMENPDTIGFGSFRLYNDDVTKFATFTKYGSKTTGGYTGIASLYPFANMLGYGNNGPFLNAGTGNIGFAITKSGTNKLKIHIDAASERVGIGGNAVPMSNVHFNNTDGAGDTLKLTNNTSGHTASDGFDIIMGNTAVRLINRENDGMTFGTNNTERARISATGNVGIGTTSPTTKLDVNGQIRMQGGSPGAGKLMVSDGTGTGSWSTPAAAGLVSGSGTTNYIPVFTPDGNTLGDSRLKDSTDGLMYNTNILPDDHTGFYFQHPIDRSSFNLHSRPGTGMVNVQNYINLTSTNVNPWMGMHFSDSARYYNWYNLGASADSVGTLYFNKDQNRFYLGNASPSKGFQVEVNSGRMGNVINNAHFTVQTGFDTAASFTSSSPNYLQGIVDVQYTGVSAGLYDSRGINVKSKTGNNYGIGINAEGGWYGVYGITDSFGSAGVRGAGIGNAIGVLGFSDAGVGVSAASYGGSAIQGYSNAANATGLMVSSLGSQGIGAHAIGDSIGVHGEGRFIGAYNEANNVGATSSTWSYGTYSTASSSAGRSYGAYCGAQGNTPVWNSYGIYAEATGTGASLYAGYFNGQIYATTGTFGTKPFTIDHPLDPANKVLRHSSIESPDMMNVYNGNVVTDANGFATVELPDYFEILNRDFKYQLTVIGTFAQAIIKEEISNNRFKIQTSQPNVKVSWLVTGVRQDAVAKKYPVVVEESKVGENKGHYYEPEAYGQPASLRIGYMPPTERLRGESGLEIARRQQEAMLRLEAEHKANNEKAQANHQPQAPVEHKVPGPGTGIR